MCGRFTLEPTATFYERFQITNRLDSLVPRYNSWQEATPRERSHDSRTHTERFMLRLDEPSQTKLQQLIKQFGASKAAIIRHLIAQAEPEDFPRLADEGSRAPLTTAPLTLTNPLTMVC